MEEKIYLIEDIYADYGRLFMNRANSKKEALDKFWIDFDVDNQNKLDKQEGYETRTKKQFKVIDVLEELGNKTIRLDY